MRALSFAMSAALSIALPAQAFAEGPGSVLQAKNCDWAGFRVVSLSGPKVISTWQFMADNNDPELAVFVAGYQLNVRPQMDAINSRFASSSLWASIEHQGDCQKRFDDPSASATSNGSNLHVTIGFRVKFVKCDTLYPGSRLDAGGARYSIVIAVWPELSYSGGKPQLSFRTDLAGTSLQVSGETAFLWDTFGRVFGTPSRQDVAAQLSQRVSEMLGAGIFSAADLIDNGNQQLAGSLDSLLQAGGSDQLSNISTPIRNAFVQSMKPTTVSWMPDFTAANQLTLRLEPTVTHHDDGTTTFPFQQKKSVMCALGHATANYFVARRDQYKIVELYTMNGQVSDPDTIYRVLR